MKRLTFTQASVTFLAGALILALAAACANSPADSPALEDTDTAIEVPAEVQKAQEAVLDFLHEGAYAISPPEGVPWEVTTGGADLPPGFSYYFFTSSDSIMSVSYPNPPDADTKYHVSIGVSSSGLCWQANVDTSGHIVETGRASEESLGADNPAALYCQAQGYEYTVLAEPSGGHCGICVYADGSICNGWAYLRGQCQPGDRRLDTPTNTE